jgi:hypothetical protein
MLSPPSSLQGPSDTLHPSLPSCRSPDLRTPYPRRSTMERVGQKAPRLLSLSPHTIDPTPGPRQAPTPFPSPADTGLPLRGKRSAHSPPWAGLSLHRTPPAIAVRHLVTRLPPSLPASLSGFGLHPWLGTTPASEYP